MGCCPCKISDSCFRRGWITITWSVLLPKALKKNNIFMFHENNSVVEGWWIKKRFKNTYELVNLGARKFWLKINNTPFSVWVRYFLWNFEGNLWHSTQNSWPKHWKRLFSFNIENLGAQIYQAGRLIVRSHAVSKTRDFMSWRSYRSQIWHASQCCNCRCACQIWEPLQKFKPESRGIETSQDPMVRRPSA